MIASEPTTAQPSEVLGHGLAPGQLPDNIGLALSGGGFRATVYHLGVLARLAHSALLERVSFLSTVSGGSLAIGLILDGEKPQWPTSDAFLSSTLPRARNLLTGSSLQWALIRKQLLRFWTILGPRADLLSGLLQSQWNVSAKVGALPERPLWYINATCVETAKNWRFERRRMGDYQFSYSADTDQVDLSDALAASAAYPGLIGRLKFPTQKYTWQAPRTPRPGEAVDDPRQFIHKGVNLWDGGAYDNLGVEALHLFGSRWRPGVDFAMVSDAAGRSSAERYRKHIFALMRLVAGIIFDQVRALRTRIILRKLTSGPAAGVFLQSGNTCAYVLKGAGLNQADLAKWIAECLPEEKVRQADRYATNIDRLKPEAFENLLRHGFEVADYTLWRHYPNSFKHIPYEEFRRLHPWRQ